MAEIQLTQAQQAAVDNRGGSLLVSAAAGSGKTKVLVERLFAYMERERCDVDDFSSSPIRRRRRRSCAGRSPPSSRAA